jgi:HEAT repeat protein
MRCLPLLLVVVLLCPPAISAQDDTDKVVLGKKVSEWVTILRDSKEVRQRRVALIALDQAGPQTRKVFEEIGIALRTDSEKIVRLAAAQVLGRLGAKARDPDRPMYNIPIKPGVDALITSLTREKDEDVRVAVALALGAIGGDAKEGIPGLGATLKDPSLKVRAAAAEALFRLGPPASAVLVEIREAVRANRHREELRVRLYLVSAIHRIGRPEGLPTVTALIDLLNEPEPAGLTPSDRPLLADVRRKTVDALGTLGDVAAAEVLSKMLDLALKTRDVTIGRSSLTALTRLAGEKKSLLPALIKAMAPEPNLLQDSYIRSGAMHAVGALGKDLGSYRKVVVEILRDGLGDKVSEVRLAAILALGELGPDVLMDKERDDIVTRLKVLRKSTEKAISEAAEATLSRLQK